MLLCWHLWKKLSSLTWTELILSVLHPQKPIMKLILLVREKSRQMKLLELPSLMLLLPVQILTLEALVEFSAKAYMANIDTDIKVIFDGRTY